MLAAEAVEWPSRLKGSSFSFTPTNHVDFKDVHRYAMNIEDNMPDLPQIPEVPYPGGVLSHLSAIEEGKCSGAVYERER